MALAKIADLKVFGINCSLKSSKDSETSSTDALMQQFFGERVGVLNHAPPNSGTGASRRLRGRRMQPSVQSSEAPSVITL